MRVCSDGFNRTWFSVVGIAQLVEPWIVIPVVVGSSPIIHPTELKQRAYSDVSPLSIGAKSPYDDLNPA